MRGGNGAEDLSYEDIEKFLREMPMTWVPALFATLIARIRKEPIFKGYMGMKSFIDRVYKEAGK